MCPFIRYLLLSFLLFAPLSGHTLELLTEDAPPHNMLKNGRLAGMSTEKLQEAFKRNDLPLHMQLTPWARAYQSALTLEEYCVFSAARTEEREGLFKWIGPVGAIDWEMYTLADTPNKPTKLEDLRNEVIGGYVQDVISVWLIDHGYHVDAASNDAINAQKLIKGRIRYWASSKPRAPATLVQEKLTGRIVSVLTFRHTDLYLACNRAVPDSVVQRLNDTLQQMRADGTSGKIDARYERWPAE